ncbi:DUF4132 domain-containing protein [Micromonospora zamorensis]|uniref:DUF4132 domain-containing protein n=1 Tax=Micromonospora zamorensis TaxID=709883 RepID=UPI002E22A85B
MAVAGGYEVTLRRGAVVCRSSAGEELRSVPRTVRGDPVVTGLEQLAEWLEQHGRDCRADVERWMIRSLPIPTITLAEVWADEAWRAALTDLVVAGLNEDDSWDPDAVGFLRDVDGNGVGVVNRDGESVRLSADRVLIPHPVLLADLDDLRALAADLIVTQPVDQLFRETWQRPTSLDPAAMSVDDFAGGRFDELRDLLARAASLGYPVQGGYAFCRIFEGGENVAACSWVGSDHPENEAETGSLVFSDGTGTYRPLTAVGPVAWSEGMRMAAALYAGRVLETSEEQQ